MLYLFKTYKDWEIGNRCNRKPHLKIFLHGEDNSARDSERSKKERKTGRRDGKITSRNGQEFGVLTFPEGSGRMGRVERYCCNVICAAPTTSERLRD